MNKGLIIIFAATVLSACGQQKLSPIVEPVQSADVLLSDEARSYDYHQSKIIGINPLVPVKADGSNLEASLRSVLDAFGVLVIDGSGGCSVTHIGKGYAVSAGHCFLEHEGKALHKSCDNFKVKWGYRGSPKPVVTGESQCTELVYAQLSNKLDFAVFRVDNAPKVAVPIAIENKPTAPNTKITIFGYPQIRPLEWSQYCSVHAASDAGKDGRKDMFAGSLFVHQCDTEPGNSGSSILAISKTEGPKVMGIHNGAGPSNVKFNYGTYMFEVRKALKKKRIDIDQLTR